MKMAKLLKILKEGRPNDFLENHFMLKFSNSNYRMVVVLFKALIVSPERDVFPLAFATAAWVFTTHYTHFVLCSHQLDNLFNES